MVAELLMKRRILIPLLVALFFAPLAAQGPLSAQIQQFWNQLRIGSLKFITVATTTINTTNVSAPTGNLNFLTGGTTKWRINTSGQLVSLGGTSGTLITGGRIASGGLSTVGTLGVGNIVENDHIEALANAPVVFSSTPTAEGAFLVSAYVVVTTATNFTFTVTCSYTDEQGNPRTLTLPFVKLDGTTVQTITNATGAGPYSSPQLQIRDSALNAITLQTVGTFTNVVYDFESLTVQVR
jgi:hypothetical protein